MKNYPYTISNNHLYAGRNPDEVVEEIQRTNPKFIVIKAMNGCMEDTNIVTNRLTVKYDPFNGQVVSVDIG